MKLNNIGINSMTQSINVFLNERKEQWLKERLKKAQNDSEIAELNRQANDKFSPKQWLPDAAKRVGQLSMVSHPSKFSHPSAKTSTVIALAQYSADGYLRSGNISYPLDVFGNAAAMDVYKFLSIELSNGKSILENLEQDVELLSDYFKVSQLEYEVLRTDFLKIKAIDSSSKTDHLVKQVYFPIQEQEYHLLSILTASGVVTELKKRIDYLRFSDETKNAKENRKKIF
jgi:CRISPR-associated protein Csy1